MPTTAPKEGVFRPFCDSCGTKFEEGQLRPQSKFCSSCGEELSPWIRRLLASGASQTVNVTQTPGAPSISTGQRAVAQLDRHGRGQNDKDEEEDGIDREDSPPIIGSGTRGRGLGRGRGRGKTRGISGSGRGRGGGRGRGRGRGRGLISGTTEPITHSTGEIHEQQNAEGDSHSLEENSPSFPLTKRMKLHVYRLD